MFYSLQKLINLPEETLFFPSLDNAQESLKFAEVIEPDNPMIKQKLKLCEEAKAKNDFCVPGKIIEERMINPFIRCAKDPYYKEITKEEDVLRIFTKLCKLREKL